MAFAQVIIIMSIEIIYCYFVQTIYFKPEYINFKSDPSYQPMHI